MAGISEVIATLGVHICLLVVHALTLEKGMSTCTQLREVPRVQQLLEYERVLVSALLRVREDEGRMRHMRMPSCSVFSSAALSLPKLWLSPA